jgi:CheY-like chemotaxis protein
MAAKRALVVDDSKSARVVLSRMLEKYGIAVNTAESAEAALDYLRQERPDVVFMDHLMPGMDGLQAVRILKADPATESIPIVMYTSQEGELYVGQAKAVGAVGVLPKTVKPIDVTKVLYQLRLLADRRDDRPSELQLIDPVGQPAAPAEPVGEPRPHAAPADEPVVDARTRGFVEAVLKEQSLELRRFMVASLDSQAQRLIAELKRPEPEAPENLPSAAPRAAERPWPWILAFGATLLALIVLASLYWQSSQTARDVEQARERLERESAALQSTLAQVREAGRAQSQTPPRTLSPASRPRVEVLPVPYGEPPLAANRLEALRTLLAGLERNGFTGTVTVETVAGQFCLEGGPDEGYSLAPPDQPVAGCDYRGNPYDESLTGASRQPVAFANLAASVRQRTNGGIQLFLLQGPPDHVVAAYPTEARVTAGAWNEAASANNRLEISVLAK